MVFQRMLSILAFSCICYAKGSGTCPGKVNVAGYGHVSIVKATWNLPGDAAGQVEVSDSHKVIPHMKGRLYWAKNCTDGAYDHKEYVALNLLGKTLRYSVDMSGAGCGCNAAFYLTGMHQNSAISSCSDYYCDANNVCGQSCAEIDMQEANQFAWHSTLHTKTDHSGVGGGFGGGTSWNGPRNWNPSQYGPGASCIDTDAPFDVAVSFNVNAQDILQAVKVKLSQKGKNCPLQISLCSYAGMEELSAALSAGMTPTMSYWSSPDMGWMDGKGADGQGPCLSEDPGACSDSVKFYDFSITKIGEEPPEHEDSIENAKEDGKRESNMGASSHREGGICCFATGDSFVNSSSQKSSSKESFCHYCREEAIAAQDSICSRSKQMCESCGGRSTWCGPETLLVQVRK